MRDIVAIRRSCAGFTLIEVLVVSLISSILILGIVAFMQTQLRVGQAFHASVDHQRLVHGLGRIASSVQRLATPLGATNITPLAQGLAIEYVAGLSTRNCFHVPVEPHTQIREVMSLTGQTLYCESSYTSPQGEVKYDRQPLLSHIDDFAVEVIRSDSRTSTSTNTAGTSEDLSPCLAAVDLSISHEHPLTEKRQQLAQRVVFPQCSTSDRQVARQSS